MQTVFFSVYSDVLKFLISVQHIDLACIPLYVYISIISYYLNDTSKKIQFPVVHCYYIVMCVCVIDFISYELLNSFISFSRQLYFIWIEKILLMLLHYSSFYISFLSFSCLIALSKISFIMVNRSNIWGHPFLIPGVRGKAVNLLS